MGLWLQQKSMTLNDLERQFTARQCYAYCNQQLRIELCSFRYKVALYLSHLHIKSDDKIQWESLRISSRILD